MTRYIAEFINTLSSLAYSQLCAVHHIYLLTSLVVYGIYGLASCDKFPTAPRLIPYCGLMGVGICSGGYHMTLKYHTQMCTPPLHSMDVSDNLVYQSTNYQCTSSLHHSSIDCYPIMPVPSAQS